MASPVFRSRLPDVSVLGPGEVLLRAQLSIRQCLDLELMGVCPGHKTERATPSPRNHSFDTKAIQQGSWGPLGRPELAAWELSVAELICLRPWHVQEGSMPRLQKAGRPLPETVVLGP